MIDVLNINKTFYAPHEIKALVNVTTKIEPGEVVVVCGPSGSGKSTFLRCLNHLETADSGHILIDGTDILDPKTNINKLRAEVGMVFQSFNLFPHKSVLENVTLAQVVVRKRSKEESHKTAMALLEKVGIQDKAGVYPDQLSGGQQQRVAVARAIVSEPKLVLADEPTANLDSRSMKKLMTHFSDLNRMHKVTFMIATHDQRVMDWAERRIYMVDGQVTRDELQGS